MRVDYETDLTELQKWLTAHAIEHIAGQTRGPNQIIALGKTG